MSPDPHTSCGPYTPNNPSSNKFLVDRKSIINQDNHDTIGMIAISEHGKVAAGTSTNGLTHKIPGYHIFIWLINLIKTV